MPGSTRVRRNRRSRNRAGGRSVRRALDHDDITCNTVDDGSQCDLLQPVAGGEMARRTEGSGSRSPVLVPVQNRSRDRPGGTELAVDCRLVTRTRIRIAVHVRNLFGFRVCDDVGGFGEQSLVLRHRIVGSSADNRDSKRCKQGDHDRPDQDDRDQQFYERRPGVAVQPTCPTRWRCSVLWLHRGLDPLTYGEPKELRPAACLQQ